MVRRVHQILFEIGPAQLCPDATSRALSQNLSVSEIVWSTDFAIWAILVRTTARGSAKDPLNSIGLEIPVLTNIHFCGTMVVMAVFWIISDI